MNTHADVRTDEWRILYRRWFTCDAISVGVKRKHLAKWVVDKRETASRLLSHHIAHITHPIANPIETDNKKVRNNPILYYAVLCCTVL